MKYAKIEAGIVVQVQPYEQAGFVLVPDYVVPGMIDNGDGTFSNPPVPLEVKREEMIDAVRNEGLSRMQEVLPGIDNFDTLDLIKEVWLSIAPAARAPTVSFQYIIDVYQAGKTAINFLKTATESQIDSYDPVLSPSWPVTI